MGPDLMWRAQGLGSASCSCSCLCLFVCCAADLPPKAVYRWNSGKLACMAMPRRGYTFYPEGHTGAACRWQMHVSTVAEPSGPTPANAPLCLLIFALFQYISAGLRLKLLCPPIYALSVCAIDYSIVVSFLQCLRSARASPRLLVTLAASAR